MIGVIDWLDIGSKSLLQFRLPSTKCMVQDITEASEEEISSDKIGTSIISLVRRVNYLLIGQILFISYVQPHSYPISKSKLWHYCIGTNIFRFRKKF